MAQSKALSRRAMLAAPVIIVAGGKNPPALAEDVASILLLGWSGDHPDTPSATALAAHVKASSVAGVFFVKENVGTADNVKALVHSFSSQAQPIIAIDHEGGWVQRLGPKQGVAALPSAHDVAETYSVTQARALYYRSGLQVAGFGITLNLAPVADLQYASSGAIGHFDRGFSANPQQAAQYAGAALDGFTASGLSCCLKHFPGDGQAQGDSHLDLPEASNWTKADLIPFKALLRAQAVMVGHVRIKVLDDQPIPVSLSHKVVTGLLRDQLGFTGVAITDDLDMTAVRLNFDRKEAIIHALIAGNDLLMIRNVTDADPELPSNAVAWVSEAVVAGRLSRGRVAQAAIRVRRMRSLQPGGPMQ